LPATAAKISDSGHNIRSVLKRTDRSALFNDAINCSHYAESMADKLDEYEAQRNDADREKSRFPDENLTQCHFFRQIPTRTGKEFRQSFYS
jgi:hypothetical protein